MDNRQQQFEFHRANWRFDSPPDEAVITTASILEGQPILFVARDEEDGGWQFLDGRDVDIAEAKVVSLMSIVLRDEAILDLTDLPPGWVAERYTSEAPWRRGRIEEVEE